jgi:cytochrome oxidase Cu insertion factor (SCO1/SenC/PrrC family)
MRTLATLTFLALTMLVLGACAAPATPLTAPATEPAMDDATTTDDATDGAAEEAHDMATESMEGESMEGESMEGEGMEGESTEGESMEGESMEGESMEGESMEGEGVEDHGETAVIPAVERPAWQQIALTDARTGATFALADFAGKTVFVEPFATWCSNCKQQLGNVQAARAQLGDDVVFVALSVEPNIGNEALVKYADETGFDWTFAAMPPELLQALAATFGQTVANPPATPHFIIRPDGSVTDLATGIKAPDVIVAAVVAAAQ